MYFFNPTASGFDRPQNTSLEDSIYMPQNHNNRNRRRAGNKEPPNMNGNSAATPPARNIGTAAFQRPATQSRQIYPLRSWDNADAKAPGSMGRNTSTFAFDESVMAERRVVSPGKQNEPRRTSGARPQPANKSSDNHTGLKVLYSKIHEQHSKTAAKPDVGFDFTSHLPGICQTPPSSPMRLVNMPARRPDLENHTDSPTLEHVRKLRADEQGRALAQLGKGLGRMVSMQPNHSRTAAPGKKGKSLDFIPELELSGSERSKPLHAITDTSKSAASEVEEVPEKRLGGSLPAVPHRIVSREVNQRNDIERLARVLAETDVFQNITSKPPTTPSSKNKVAVPRQFKLETTKTTKTNKKLDDVPANVESNQGEAKELVQEEAKKSKQSVASFDSDEFKKVEIPAVDESEHNGVSRKWYKGFIVEFSV
jgi:hypothetical protein